MNYKAINTAILNSSDVPKSIKRDKQFYDYLLSNNTAYYYSRYLSKDKTLLDKKIIAAGESLNGKFLRTLSSINKLCRKNRIKYLLFKTYKYIPEVVDGDLDLFIAKKDFYRFLQILEDEGFECIENEKLSAVCYKTGFCNIEPRVKSSFHGLVVLDESKVWEKKDNVNIGGMQLYKVTKEIDLLHLLLSVLYRPDYLKLYLLLAYRGSDIKKILALTENQNFSKDLNFLLSNLIMSDVENKRFPLFMGNIDFVIWWARRILPVFELTLSAKIKHIVFFFYSKYSYLLFNRLVFKHNWPLK